MTTPRCRHPKSMRVQLVDGTDGTWCSICQRRIAPARLGAGRKPRAGAASDETLRYRCSEAEKAEIIAACRAIGRDHSDVARELLLAWARRQRQ